MIYLYFYLISFSLIGYGLILKKIIKVETSNFGLLGLLGLTFLSLISYISSPFLNMEFYLIHFFYS